MGYLFLLLPALTVIIIHLIFKNTFNAAEKIDKGIVFCYWKLSYRRKFIRTLWLLPIFIIIMVLFHLTFRSYFLTCIVGVAYFLLLLAQAIYNYRKWHEGR